MACMPIWVMVRHTSWGYPVLLHGMTAREVEFGHVPLCTNVHFACVTCAWRRLFMKTRETGGDPCLPPRGHRIVGRPPEGACLHTTAYLLINHGDWWVMKVFSQAIDSKVTSTKWMRAIMACE